MKNLPNERSAYGRSFAVALAVALAAWVGTAQAKKSEKPYQLSNDSWITISGRVISVKPNQFTLDYGKGVITVEMDDGDRDADAYKLITGDRVQVTGKIDADLFQKRTIEAASVYLPKLGTTFYSSPLDEEDFAWSPVYTEPTSPYTATLRGSVTNVNAEKGTFTIAAGPRMVTVDVNRMPYNPLDDRGYQKIREGDFVSVVGWVDHDFSTGREVIADSVVILAT